MGDRLVKINDTYINDFDDFSKSLCSLRNNCDVSVLINRGFRNITINTDKNTLQELNFNNTVSGYATLTYVNPSNNSFGAVAHPISVGSSKAVNINSGTISSTDNLSITKSYCGSVGSLCGSKLEKIGSINKNSDFGIKGSLNNIDLSNFESYKIADLKDVKLGKAYVFLQDGINKPSKYEVEILKIENQRTAKSKTFKIKVVDEDLLDLTGGIVQGMSGAPIVQDDKIIGAVSHALENDPACGYAVFIRWMLE